MPYPVMAKQAMPQPGGHGARPTIPLDEVEPLPPASGLRAAQPCCDVGSCSVTA